MVKANLGSHGVYLKTDSTSGTVAFYENVDRTTILIGIYLHLNAAPTINENYTICRDAVSGSVYDTVLFSSDLSVDVIGEDLVIMFAEPFYLVDGDVIRIDYPNTSNITVSTTLVIQEAKLHKSI